MILENKKYEIVGSTKCSCGHEFVAREMQELKRVNQDGFYGNIVKHYGHATCPNCNKNVILLLKQKGQTYVVLDTAVEISENVNKTIETDVKNVQISVETPTQTIEEETKQNNEITCPICGKVCKSQIGYNSHMKTHKNN